MKSIIALVLAFGATVASATPAIVPGRVAQNVLVDSIDVSIVGEHGWPMQDVKVQATFSNACEVPEADELVMIVNYADGMDTLLIALGRESDRVCTREYAPVTVTIALGQYVRPADGLFSKIVVNGVERIFN